MEMRAEITSTIPVPVEKVILIFQCLQNRHRHDITRFETKSLDTSLKIYQIIERFRAETFTTKGSIPVKFLFCVDHDDQKGWLAHLKLTLNDKNSGLNT